MVDPNSRSDPKLQELMKVRRDGVGVGVLGDFPATSWPWQMCVNHLFCKGTIQETLKERHSHSKERRESKVGTTPFSR